MINLQSELTEFKHGQIASMTLPQGWIEGPRHKFTGGFGNRTFREVHPVEAPGVRMCFYFRGLPCSDEAAKAFQQLLALAPHSLGYAELAAITEILRDKQSPEEFALKSARTIDLNGRRVLMVEGFYKEVAEESAGIFVDGLHDGRFIQEIIYQAPADLFARYLKVAEQAIGSIKWEPSDEASSSGSE